MRYCTKDNCKRKYQAKGLCAYHYKQKWQKDNQEKVLEYQLIYRKLYPERYRESSRESDKKWRKENPEEYKKLNRKKQKKWRESNIEKSRAKVRKYNKDNPEKILYLQLKRLEKLGFMFDMTSNKYRYGQMKWSALIKTLDNNICKLCNSKENLHAHHIQPKAQFPKLSFDPSNGITLCRNCHSKIHGHLIY